MIVLAVALLIALAICACVCRCAAAFRMIAGQVGALVDVTRELGRKVDALGRGPRGSRPPIGYRLTPPTAPE